MPGRKALRRVQFVKEATSGTAVGVATAIWRGTADTLSDERVVVEVPEHVGIIGGLDRTFIGNVKGTIALPAVNATFEQIGYLPAYAFGGPLAGTLVAGTTPTGYSYTTNIPTTVAPAIQSATFQAGDDFEVEQMEYSVCNHFDISGMMGEGVKVASKWIGRQVARLGTGFTGAITIPAVEDIVASKAKFYVDPISGAYGTTLVSNQILGFKINFDVMYEPKWTLGTPLSAENSPLFSFLVYVGHKITGEITFEHDTAVSGSAGARQDFRQQTPRKIRLYCVGSALATPGTLYTTKALIIDLPIKYNKLPVVSDKNGNDIVTMSFFSRYNVTAGDAGKIIVITDGVINLP